jgi:hypothetical protein
MAILLTSYKEIGFTILPQSLTTELQMGIVKYSTKDVIGYVTHKNTGEFKFIYANLEGVAESDHHWSFDIIKKLPYDKMTDTWIVFNCPPDKMKHAYKGILYGESIDIQQWDTWSVDGIDAKVAVITSWEIL